MGLALATWTPRLGRAIGITVTIYVLATIGLYFALELAAGPNEQAVLGLAAGSPPVGVGLLTVDAFWDRNGFPRPEFEIVELIMPYWTIFYAMLATALVVATLWSFNRCLGRVDDRPRAVRPASDKQPAVGGPFFRARTGRSASVYR
jgi:hypothetical protein